ncbi:hypothetical protein [Shewanella sp. UCD-KL12]|uniref:hypothetical protein n=1 Tax=Shewanella sp. UCD-KL12 TaxID=1917163 RepID=UPI0009705AED|nr:hypothetical protein [Shewanella sp. UCD-KL12]
MIFEGSEKIIEIGLTEPSSSLRQQPASFWQELVASAGAEIISHIQNDDCDAYLLSESSLFVWDKRIRMLTCGETQLCDALVFFIEHFGSHSIAYSTYQRKNEYLQQPEIRSFQQDLEFIKTSICGKGYRVGHLDSHHHYLFVSANQDTSIKPLSTTELLMYHLAEPKAVFYRSKGQTSAAIRAQLALDKLFQGFIFDDHLFTPFGYSLNGIKGDKYFTIHITPQAQSSYCSFETNIAAEELPAKVLEQFLKNMAPERWDLIAFDRPLVQVEPCRESCINTCSIRTEGDYDVHFKHVHQPHKLPFAEVI